MSVIVKGMKMPKNCLHCDFDDSYGICACRNEAPYVCEYSAKQRPSWCPLEEVPPAQPETHDKRTETHSCDCISRQAAIDYCYALINAENPSDEWNYSQERINQTEVILHHLEVMPSAQPETHDKRTETHACVLIIRRAVEHLDWFTKLYCRDKSITDDLAFRCKQCEFAMPDGICLVKTMARKLCPDYKDFGAMGDL